MASSLTHTDTASLATASASSGGATMAADIDYGGGGGEAFSTTGIFSADYKRHDDLKQMLNSNRDSLKLEAMKRIITMVARGRDASELFPAVVKNVVSKNIELKKLVYTYLVRYAEQQQDLALLSISTFQRALKDPNQLIRANALRVLSSIRVPMIVPIMMLAINDCVVDMSPYVRKTVAHAIPKLYSLDSGEKVQLVDVIERLLADRSTLVIGSAVMAFQHVCPERIELVHVNYRKLCRLLVDVDEWGQLAIVHTLTRYARTQFVNPNATRSQFGSKADTHDRPFYDTNTDTDTDTDKEDKDSKARPPPVPALAPDHRLLLNSARPLLYSRNAAVVMSVVQLFYHVAPYDELTMSGSSVLRAMMRLCHHTQPAVHQVALTCVASLSAQSPGLFEPYLKSFFVFDCDSHLVKTLKLAILTNLASEANASLILREFQTYIGCVEADGSFVAATIQAIGRCAASISSITDTCLHGLVQLLSHTDECIVGESVCVIKHLLQTQPDQHGDIIKMMAKRIQSINVAAARASILWLIGEYCNNATNAGRASSSNGAGGVSLAAAVDILRQMAKTFTCQEPVVKLQILNLASKLCLQPATAVSRSPSNTVDWQLLAHKTEQLASYVLQLGRYDSCYDVRDRSRLLQALVFPAAGVDSLLGRYCRRVLLANKPPAVYQSVYQERVQFQLGSMSHFLNTPTIGYTPLPPFATTESAASVRDPPPLAAPPHTPPVATEAVSDRFYADSSSCDDNDSSSDDSDVSSYSSSSGSSTGYTSSCSENDQQHCTSDDRQGSSHDHMQPAGHTPADAHTHQQDSSSNVTKQPLVISTRRPVQVCESSDDSSTESSTDSSDDSSSSADIEAVKNGPGDNKDGVVDDVVSPGVANKDGASVD